jgi:hypothetical protein
MTVVRSSEEKRDLVPARGPKTYDELAVEYITSGGIGAVNSVNARIAVRLFAVWLDKKHTPEDAQPVAYVPVHPRTGALWANTVPTLDSERPAHYPVMALYSVDQCGGHAPETNERQHVKAAVPSRATSCWCGVTHLDTFTHDLGRCGGTQKVSVWYGDGGPNSTQETQDCPGCLDCTTLKADPQQP